MGRRRSVEVDRLVLLELDRRQARSLSQEGDDVFDRIVEAIDDGVDLGAQARREERYLLEVLMGVEGGEDLAGVAVGHGDALEHVEGCLGVLDSDDDDCHVSPRSLGP